MSVQNPQGSVSSGRGTIAKLTAILLFAGISLAAQAQQTIAEQPSRGPEADKATSDPPAPPPGAMPAGDPKSGVLKPPDVDPEMAKAVPDVDPAMDDAQPGKKAAPDIASPPKVQPK